MFTILPVDDAKAAVLAAREKMVMPLSALLLTVDDKEEGYALFRVERDTVKILCLRSPDDDLAEWLVRAVLNAAANRLAITATCGDPVLFPLLERLNFTQVADGYEVFIPEFFNRPCHHG